MEATITTSYTDLADRLRKIFARHGCSPDVATLLGENCAAAERDGVHSHGIFRMRGYVASLKAGGWVDGRAVPVLRDAAPGFLRIDGMNGFTVPALAAGKAAALGKVRENGVALIAIRNSHHLGALSLDVEAFAAEGLVALSFINAMKSVVPFGGRSAALGTNPIAFAAPRASGFPFVFDMATSAMANGDVQIAARTGAALPPGCGVDRNGAPTTDPRKIVDGGALLTFGGHKGAALSVMVEILCAALGGGKFSAEVDLKNSGGGVTPHTGQTFILIDPDAGRAGLEPFVERLETLFGYVREAGQRRLPGDRRYATRARSLREGITLRSTDVDLLESLEHDRAV